MMFEQVARPAPVGLLTKEAPVPLDGVAVEAWVKDLCARVVVTQKYRNQETTPIEAVYVFPLDEGAAVCGFEAQIGEVHVVGRVKEREQAFEDYDDALQAGHGAYLLDQEKPDVFTASIGNVPPGKDVTVRIKYVTELGAEGDALRFTLPATVSPRYAPAEDRKGVGRPPAEALNPPVAMHVPYGLSFALHCDMSSRVQSIGSPTHPVSVELDANKGEVRLGTRDTALDRDLVLHIRPVDAATPRAVIEEDDAGRRAVLLSFLPKIEADQAPTEVIFVIDRSGSMQGTSIVEARNALLLCLRGLTEGTRFNIVGFGSTFEMLFPASREYNDQTLSDACARVSAIEADLGGTEILAPLKAIFEREPARGMPRQLFVLTDGEVTNTDAVIQLIRQNSHTTRVFSFGIGAGPSRHLILGMARAGGGAAEFISPGERVEPKVVRQLGKALAPAFTEVKVNWGALKALQAPHHVPPVFAGGRVIIYGFMESEAAGDVELSVVGPAGPLSFRVRIDPATAQPGKIIGTLAARAMIRDLEEGMSPLHDRRGSLQARVKKDQVRDEIVRLGVSYGLCSRETSFVAVEKREKPVEGEMQLRRVPVALTRDWGGIHGDTGIRMASLMVPAGVPSSAGAGFFAAAAEAMSGVLSSIKEHRPLRMKRAPPIASSSAAAVARPASEETAVDTTQTTRTTMHRLLALARADGSWELNDALAAVIGKPITALDAALPAAQGEPSVSRRAWATALALAWLERNASELKGEWELAAKKALGWLKRSKMRPAGGSDWTELAKELLTKR